jgi:8-oxo-dGTP pyrophosphatase MutT (NUDIX family)
MGEGDKDSDLAWNEEYREKQSSFGIFDIYSVTRVSPQGRRGSFILVDAADWVTVVPLVKDAAGRDCFLMVRQFRHGNRKVTIEFPAGVIERDEEPAEGAARELLEETGRSAANLVLLGSSSPNPAFMTNATYTFLATHLGPPDKQRLDALEEVEIVTIPIDEVVASMGTKAYANSIMMAALGYYLRWESWQEKSKGARRLGAFIAET